MKAMKKLLLVALMAPAMALASGNVHLDKANYDLGDQASLQRGAQIFVNYCLGCHSANYMRYNRMQDIGLSEEAIKQNLMFTTDKVGDLMTIPMSKQDAAAWFGAAPPDLTVIARSRGADWLYTYLRGFYRDESRPTGWNNTVFDKVGMPHVLYELQGEQAMETVKEGEHKSHKLVLAKPGKLKPAEYDAAVNDLVGYLVWMGEPAQQSRVKIGFVVLIFLALFFVVAYKLKKEYWKDVH